VLFNNTTGFGNVGIGFDALVDNTTGNDNAASGAYSLYSNTIGSSNSASGIRALYSNTEGSYNTASGQDALLSNTTGGNNTAVGVSALLSNTNGGANTATGYNSLAFNTTGANNTAMGAAALFSNNTGGTNTAVGINALENNTSGSSNIAVGNSAWINLTTGKNNIDIGNAGVAGESNKIRIGTSGTQKPTFIAAIRGVTVPSGVGVVVGTDGKLGTVVSSAQYKEKIRQMDKASEAILELEPVTFQYRKDLDPEGIPQFGLVAEQVEKVDPDLVAKDEQGKPYTVRYEAVNAMLLNEFLKEHRTVEALDSQNREQDAIIAKQQAEIDVLRSQIQKVSDQLAASKLAPQLITGNP
jgi:trimeric autotransporter adhesin